MIRDNVARMRDRIATVCRKIGKDPSEITLVGVTKTADTVKINEAIEAGLVHIGENKVQEAKKKYSSIKKSKAQVICHMIGHLQTNKVRHALDIFDIIESVDSLKLAEAIEAQAALLGKKADVLIQVNTAREPQKFGVTPEDAAGLLEILSGFKHIRVLGLMAIAPLVEDEKIIRRCFRDLKVLHDRFKEKYQSHERIEMEYLSMGMSADFEIALEEGANMIRIGRAIFQE